MCCYESGRGAIYTLGEGRKMQESEARKCQARSGSRPCLSNCGSTEGDAGGARLIESLLLSMAVKRRAFQDDGASYPNEASKIHACLSESTLD